MFYTILIREQTQAIFAYAELQDAVGKFHAEMAYAHDANLRTTCLVVDSMGCCVKAPEVYEPAEVI